MKNKAFDLDMLKASVLLEQYRQRAADTDGLPCKGGIQVSWREGDEFRRDTEGVVVADQGQGFEVSAAGGHGGQGPDPLDVAGVECMDGVAISEQGLEGIVVVEFVIVGAIADLNDFPQLGHEQIGPKVIDAYTLSEVFGGEVGSDYFKDLLWEI